MGIIAGAIAYGATKALSYTAIGSTIILGTGGIACPTMASMGIIGAVGGVTGVPATAAVGAPMIIATTTAAVETTATAVGAFFTALPFLP